MDKSRALRITILCFFVSIQISLAQKFVPAETQMAVLKDSIRAVDYTNYADSLKSIYWLNRIQLELSELYMPNRERRMQVFGKFADSASYWANKGNCQTCQDYIQLVKVNYLSDNDSIVPLPTFRSEYSKNLRLHWLCTRFNLHFKLQKEFDSTHIAAMYDLVIDTNVNLLQRIVVSDFLATNYYFQRGDYERCDELYNIAIEAMEKDKFETNPWKLQLELPGIHSLPIQKISRCYLNQGLVKEKLGDFSSAAKYLKYGADLYAKQKDTLGLLWAYKDLSRAYGSQMDFDNAKGYIDSSMHILEHGSNKTLGTEYERLSYFLFNHFYLTSTPGVSSHMFSRIESLLDKDYGLSNNPAELLHISFLRINIVANKIHNGLAQKINMNPGDIDDLIDFDLTAHVYDQQLRSLVLAQYFTLKSYLEGKSEFVKLYQKYSDELNLEEYKTAFYLFAKVFLNQKEDTEFLLALNDQLLRSSGKGSFSNLILLEDRYKLWENTNTLDSALVYYKSYASAKEKLVNRENYIRLAQADLELEKLEQQKIADELKLESVSSKQRSTIFGLLALSFLMIAVILRQKRIKDKIQNEKNQELLLLKAESEEQKNIILKSKNQKLEKDLHDNIIEVMQSQNRNIELAEMIEELKSGAESSFVDRKAKEIKLKLNEYSAEETLLEIERKAWQLYPDLCNYLNSKLSQRNKMEFLLCIMLVMDYSTEDIARLQMRSEKAIKSLRYRVRKRLGLEESQDLNDHLRSFNLRRSTN